MALIFLIGIIFLVILNYISPKKINKVLNVILLIYLIVMMGANTQNPDTYIYETVIYNNDNFFTKDIGFGLLIFLFKKFP